jgi:hypothetical protein
VVMMVLLLASDAWVASTACMHTVLVAGVAVSQDIAHPIHSYVLRVRGHQVSLDGAGDTRGGGLFMGLFSQIEQPDKDQSMSGSHSDCGLSQHRCTQHMQHALDFVPIKHL